MPDTAAPAPTAAQAAREVLALEARALDALAADLPADFAATVDLVLNTAGRVIVSGAKSRPPWPAPARPAISSTRARRAMATLA